MVHLMGRACRIRDGPSQSHHYGEALESGRSVEGVGEGVRVEWEDEVQGG